MNPKTNRCNKQTVKKLKECPPGSFLNIETNRCNKQKVKKLKECPPGSLVNIETNRCNKVKAVKKNKMADKLYFHSKSKDVAPGMGVNETVENAEDYAELATIPHWRKVLSNFHLCPFKYMGYTYNTIEHVFQAKKIELVSPNKAYLFTLESGDEIGKGDGGVARKNRKLALLDKDVLTKWAKMRNKVMYEAALAKYSVSPEALTVLKATGSAQLWHVVSRSKVHDHFEHLERVRSEL